MNDNKEVHPFARKCLIAMKRPDVLHERQALESQGWYDFASNTNPNGMWTNVYPDLACKKLKKAYRQVLVEETVNCLVSQAPSDDEMLVCRGITDGIELLIRGFCEPGQNTVLIPEPTFFMYEYWAKANSVDIEKTQLTGENYNRVNIEAVQKSTSKLIFLCSPNNPVGTTLQIEHIAEIARATKALVIVDEAYIEYSKEPSSVRLIKEYPNVVVLRTLSKAWGLAGVRCGVVIAQPSIINALSLVQGPFAIPYHSQDSAAHCLERRNTVMEQVATTRIERARVASKLASSRHVKRVFPSEANFLLVEFDNAKAIYERLLKKKIIVDPAWHHIPNTIRISISRAITNDVLLADL